jgi:hypothetical protein
MQSSVLAGYDCAKEKIWRTMVAFAFLTKLDQQRNWDEQHDAFSWLIEHRSERARRFVYVKSPRMGLLVRNCLAVYTRGKLRGP